MPTDLGLIIANLAAFYDWRDKAVVHVGAGGGQLLGYARACRRVIAVDRDAAAVARLEAKIRELGWGIPFEVVMADFMTSNLSADVVLFEFCLHEMLDPSRALSIARRTARDVLVIDHRADSPWSWYANESGAMTRAWDAVAAAGVRRESSYAAVQRFGHGRELEARFAALGEEAWRRIAVFRDRADIEIPMPYGIALL